MAEMRITGIAAHEHDDSRLDLDVESDLPRFLSLVLETTDQISQAKLDDEMVEQHIVVVNQTVHLLRTLRDSGSNIIAELNIPLLFLFALSIPGIYSQHLRK